MNSQDKTKRLKKLKTESLADFLKRGGKIQKIPTRDECQTITIPKKGKKGSVKKDTKLADQDFDI
jgi:hypothetical protein